MTVRLLGIDAGFAAMGVVVAEGERIIHSAVCHTERTAKKRGVRVADDDAERLQMLADFLRCAIQVWTPMGAVVELPGGAGKSSMAVKAMAMGHAAAVLTLHLLDFPAEWVTPQMVKKAATGSNNGAKGDVAKVVLSRFTWDQGALPRHKQDDEHIYDAAGALFAARQGTLVRALKALERGVTA